MNEGQDNHQFELSEIVSLHDLFNNSEEMCIFATDIFSKCEKIEPITIFTKRLLLMKITFLGTGAAPSCPLPFCMCEFCRVARERGGENLRKRSSVIVNDDLLVDMGPDIMSAASLYGKSIADIRYLLQTHSHSDHFDPQILTTRAPEYMGVNTPVLQIHASTGTLMKMAEMVRNEGYVNNFLDARKQRQMKLQVFPVKPFQSFRMGCYQINSFASDHDRSVESLVWAITQDDCTLFYGTDTDRIQEDTWKAFKEKKLKFNIVVLDHTYGPGADGSGHLNAVRFDQQVQRMRAEALLAVNARILATHISHEGNLLHVKLSQYATKFGYEIAYDGLVVE